MTGVLGEVFLASALLAGAASIWAYLGWLAIQVMGNINYLFRGEAPHEDDRD